MSRNLLVARCLAGLAVCSLAAVSLAAQTTAKPGAKPALKPAAKASSTDENGWRFRPTFLTDAEFDNNVFLLPDLKKAKLVAGAPAGTHYADMVSASDVITTFRAQLAFDGPGISGKRVRIVPELGYDFNARNTARRTAMYGVSLAQKTTRGGLVRLKAAMQPQTFFKNYLLDAVDLDGNGSISSGEKLYSAARQGETTVEGDYTLRLRKQSSPSTVGAALRIGGGWYSRTNNSAFTSRDLKGPTLGAKLLLDVASHSHIDLGYSLASLSAPRMLNVMLLDEAPFNRDFNNNGTTTDVNVRTVQMVDRSRSEQELGAAFGTNLGQADVTVEYAHRTRHFNSAEPYDVANNGRRDARNEFGGTLRYNLGDALRVRARAQRGAQTLNRASATAATGDVADYTRVRTSIGLEYRF